jgi:hypothetical protein
MSRLVVYNYNNKKSIYYGKNYPHYFSEVEDPRVEGRCLHLLSDLLMVSLLTYLTGGTDYQDMHLFAKERGREFPDFLFYFE